MRALVLSGGGSKGSYQVGVLKYILGELKTDYDIYCGVSVGAINCAFLSMFKSGQEEKASKILSETWLKLDTSKIYQRWFPFGRWHALWRQSFFDSSPLKKLIESKLDMDVVRASGKKVGVGTVSVSSGKYKIFDQNSPHFVKSIIASASFPGMLTPVSFDGELWTDGGVKELSPITAAIEMGAENIDVIITSPQNKVKRFLEKPTTVDILKRIIDLSTDRIMTNDIDKVNMYNKLVDAGISDKKKVKLNILRPHYNLTEDLLDFNPQKLKEMHDRGYYDAICNYRI